MRKLRAVSRVLGTTALVVLVGGALLASPATATSVLVSLTGDQQEPDPVLTDSFGLALLDVDLKSSLIAIEVLIVGIDIADLVPIPDVGPFHLHIETAGPPTDQNGPIAVSFGGVGDWEALDFGDGITLNAVGVNVGAFTDEEIATALVLGTTYLNLHTFDYPSGELRGDVPPIPEPATALLLGLGLLGLTVGRRR